MAAAQDAMREELDRRLDAIERSRPTFPELAEPSRPRSGLSLPAQTTTESLTRVDETVTRRRDELNQALALAGGLAGRKNVVAARCLADEAKTLKDKLSRLQDVVADEMVGDLDRLREAAARADAAVNLAVEQFAGEPVSGVGRASAAGATKSFREGRCRQVIVFTHDIQLMLELIGEADKQGVPQAGRGI